MWLYVMMIIMFDIVLNSADAQAESTNTLPVEISPTKFLEEIDKVFVEYEADMSSEEAQEHLISIIMLAACLAEEIRKLSGTSIKTDARNI